MLTPNGWCANVGVIWLPNGFRVRIMVDGEDLMEVSLATFDSCVMGFGRLLKMLMTESWSSVRETESGWVVMKLDQLSCMIRA